MTSRRIQSHKDYRTLMEKHRRSSRGKRLLRSLIYILILLGMLLLIYFGVQKLAVTTSDETAESARTEQVSRPGLTQVVERKPMKDEPTKKP
jgi:predicted nucleic acid-binding Zn ribbon protein